MADRSCALKSAAYMKLKAAFDCPSGAVKRFAAGRKTAWMLGDDVPEEVLLAAGFAPVRLTGYYGGERTNADKYLEISFGALWRGLFEAVLRGADDMDYLVMSNSSDIIQRLFYYLQEFRNLEPERKLPTLGYVDYFLMPRDFRAQERNWNETKDFIALAEKWSGKKITAEALSEAAAQVNAHRQAVRVFSALRYGEDSRVLGSEALTAIAGSFYFDKKEAAALLTELAEDAKSWDKTGLVPVFYTGSMQETREVYELMEKNGLNAVSEDKILGDRYADADVDMSVPVVRAIAMRYHLRFPSSERGFIKARAEAVPARVAEVGAKAMLMFMNHNDESYIWDYPKQKPALEKLGVRTLTIEDQYWPLRGAEETERLFAAFAKEVG